MGVAIFWRLLPTAFFAPKIPAVFAFLTVALGFAGVTALVLLRNRDGSAIPILRDLIVACAALWFAVRFIAPMASQQVGILTAVPPPAQSAIQQTPPPAKTIAPSDWRNIPPGPWAGPIGPIMAIEIVQTFQQLPQPCVVKVTAPSENDNLRSTLNWILEYGAKCEIAPMTLGPPNADEPQSAELQPNSNSGMIIHWAADYPSGENASHFFDSSTFKVSISHRLPPNSNPHLIWIDIGPGSPWKNL